MADLLLALTLLGVVIAAILTGIYSAKTVNRMLEHPLDPDDDHLDPTVAPWSRHQ